MKIQRSVDRPHLSSTEPQPVPAVDYIRYTRRILPDAEIYFIFNEGEQTCTFTAEFDRVGEVTTWDGITGQVSNQTADLVDDKILINLEMPAWDSRIIVIR